MEDLRSIFPAFFLTAEPQALCGCRAPAGFHALRQGNRPPRGEPWGNGFPWFDRKRNSHNQTGFTPAVMWNISCIYRVLTHNCSGNPHVAPGGAFRISPPAAVAFSTRHVITSPVHSAKTGMIWFIISYYRNMVNRLARRGDNFSRNFLLKARPAARPCRAKTRPRSPNGAWQRCISERLTFGKSFRQL